MSDILAEPLFDWFINIYRPSTFSCKEKEINNYSLSLYKPISFMKMSSEKSIFTSIQSTTLPCIILRTSFIRYLLPQHSVSTFGIEKVFGSMETLPAIQKMLVYPADFSTRPVGRALWEESLILSKIHSSIRAEEWNFCPLTLHHENH